MPDIEPEVTIASARLNGDRATEVPTDVAVGAASLSPQERVTFVLGDRLVWAFVLGLLFFASVLGTELGLKATGRAIFLEVDDLVKVATTFGSIIGPPLGFVISYYFKESAK